jgi:hypothetical protein
MAAAETLGLPLVVHDDPDWPPSRDQLLRGVQGASAIITLLTERIDDEVLDAAGSVLCILGAPLLGTEEFSPRT